MPRFRDRAAPTRCLMLLVGSLVLGCSAATPQSVARPNPQAESAHGASTTGAPKRLVAATKNVPSFLYYKLHSGPTAGAEEIGDLLSSGLAVADDQGLLRPRLGEAVPSLDNGLWQLSPDGTMLTTVRIREGARWHDGTPLTAQDLAFTLTVSRDQELAALRHVGYDSIDSYEVVDPRTLRVNWKRPYIEADALFSTRFALPLPSHLLAQPYADSAENRQAFLEIPYWTEEFVGTGPFKLVELARGSLVRLQANDAYLPARPKVDEVEVRFITDDNTFVANLLAGAVDFTLGRGPSLEQSLIVRDQWQNGRMDFKSLDSWLVVYPQFVNPNPEVVANPQFRRALLHAIDREELVATIQHGMVPVADGNISPNHPRYREVEPSIVRHEYDPRKATQMIEALGFARAADGFRDGAGQRLAVQIRATTVLDILPKSAYAVGDNWQRLGLAVETEIRPTQAARDPEWAATFPGFALQRQTGSHRFLPNLRSSQARLPARNYQGLNVARYMSPEMDGLIERYLTTIPNESRARAIADIVHRVTEDAIWLTLFFDTEPSLISDRVRNLTARGEDSNHAWNAHEWDVVGGSG